MANTTNTTTNELSIIAQALSVNRDLKKERITASSIGNYKLAVEWRNAVLDTLVPAYAVWTFYHDKMGLPVEVNTPVNAETLNKLYDKVRAVLDLIGEVRGEKLVTKNCVDAIIAEAHDWTYIDISNEMAHARNMLKIAREAVKNATTDEGLAAATASKDEWTAEVKRLESTPGNCRAIPVAPKDNKFILAVERLLGDAINQEMAKPAEQVEAERLAKKEARKQQRKDAKKAKAEKQTATTNA